MSKRLKSAKRYKALGSKAAACIDRVLALLPPIEFTQIICGLLSNSIKTKREWLLIQSLEMLCSRLRSKNQDPSNYDEQGECVLMETIMAELSEVLNKIESVQPLNLTLKAIKLITKGAPLLASGEKSSRLMGSMLTRMKSMTQRCPIRAKDSIYGSLMLTASVLVSELKLKALPHLTWVIDALLNGLEKDQPGDQIKLIIIASYQK